MLPMQCSVSASVALNATARKIHAFDVAAGDICGFRRERRRLRGGGVVCPPEEQAPRQV